MAVKVPNVQYMKLCGRKLLSINVLGVTKICVS